MQPRAPPSPVGIAVQLMEITEYILTAEQHTSGSLGRNLAESRALRLAWGRDFFEIAGLSPTSFGVRSHATHQCVTSVFVDTTIRNLDERAYRELKARAALEGKTMGEMVNEAVRAYLARPEFLSKRGSLRDLRPELYPEGTERLSEEIDDIVYGT